MKITNNFGGSIDVNRLHTTTRQGSPNLLDAQTMIEAEFYDELYKANTGICRDIENLKDQEITVVENRCWLNFDQFDFGKGVSEFCARVSSEVTGALIEVVFIKT